MDCLRPKIDAWEYCNPDTEAPYLEMPSVPEICCSIGWAHEREDIDTHPVDEGNENYKSLLGKYINDCDACRQRSDNLLKVDALIRYRIAKDCIKCVFGSQSRMGGDALELLTDLQNALRPHPSREKLGRKRFDLRYMVSRPVIRSYLCRWEKLIDTIFDFGLAKDDTLESRNDILLEAITKTPLDRKADPKLSAESWINWPDNAASETKNERRHSEDGDSGDTESCDSRLCPACCSKVLNGTPPSPSGMRVRMDYGNEE